MYSMSLSKGIYAGQAEILRAAQRDENSIIMIDQMLSEILSLGGRRLMIKFGAYHGIISKLLYYLSTNAMWVQTLGEEYTGILPVTNSGLKLLTFKKMLLYVILLSGGREILTILLKKLEETHFSSWILNPAPIEGMEKYLHVFKTFIPYIDKIHKFMFYCAGSYLSIVNRLTGVKHVLVRSWYRDTESLYTFKILAIMSLLKLILSLYVDYRALSNLELDVDSYTRKDAEHLQDNCRLCLNPRRGTSVTPCGHLFCWMCIMQWLQLKKECPYCKAPVTMSRVVFLQNYDKYIG